MTSSERSGVKAVTPAEIATAKKQHMHRLLAVEHLYCAVNSKYVSEMSIAAMAVAYALCSSRLIVEILGRIGPGGSYPLLKQWL